MIPDRQQPPIVIAGAGPHGLATAVHLVTAAPCLRDRLVVVDPAGDWLVQWRDQFARLDIAHLRSPAVHHPAPRAGLLMEHTATHRLPTTGARYGLPTTEAFEHFCDALIDHHRLGSLVTSGVVVDVLAGSDDDALAVTVDVGNYRCSTLIAERLVIASNPSKPNVPEWAQDLPSDVVEPAALVDLGCIGDLGEVQVLIIGSGLTAAHLAYGAARRGARVTMVCRGRLAERGFDTDPGWLGPRELDRYQTIDDPAERLRVARAARGGGTIPSWMLGELRLLAESDKFTIVELAEVALVDRSTEGAARFDITTSDGSQRSVSVDRCWLATGTEPTLDAFPAIDRLRGRIPMVGLLPIPCRDLTIGRLPVHVTGRLATIELGPAAGNLWGARQSARRITRSITGLDLELEADVARSPGRPLSGRPFVSRT